MTENDRTESDTDAPVRATDGGLSDAEREAQIDYMEVEINLLKPATPFMRDHNRAILTGFFAWALIVFGPITATRLAPDIMTQSLPVIGFPLHYFLIAIGAPVGALLLSVWYARKRDKIDEKYGIEQMPAPTPEQTDSATDAATATDGGVDE